VNLPIVGIKLYQDLKTQHRQSPAHRSFSFCHSTFIVSLQHNLLHVRNMFYFWYVKVFYVFDIVTLM